LNRRRPKPPENGRVEGSLSAPRPGTHLRHRLPARGRHKRSKPGLRDVRMVAPELTTDLGRCFGSPGGFLLHGGVRRTLRSPSRLWKRWTSLHGGHPFKPASTASSSSSLYTLRALSPYPGGIRRGAVVIAAKSRPGAGGASSPLTKPIIKRRGSGEPGKGHRSRPIA